MKYFCSLGMRDLGGFLLLHVRLRDDEPKIVKK